MNRFTLIVAPKVQEEITAQVLRIAADSVENAFKWEGRLRSAIEGVGDMPGYSVDEDATRRLGFQIRKYVFEGTYLIHYWVDDAAGIIKDYQFSPRRTSAACRRTMTETPTSTPQSNTPYPKNASSLNTADPPAGY